MATSIASCCDEMCELIIRDAPDLVLLQEVPVWAGALLRERTGMGVTLAPAYGAHIPFLHVPLPLALGAALGRALPDLVRTQVEGQANAVLYGARAAAGLGPPRPDQRPPPPARRAAHRPARAPPPPIRRPRAALANVHADSGDNRQQLERAGYVLEQFARGAPMLLGGDLNADARSPAPAGARRPAAGSRTPQLHPGVDHLFVRGMQVESVPATRGRRSSATCTWTTTCPAPV